MGFNYNLQSVGGNRRRFGIVEMTRVFLLLIFFGGIFFLLNLNKLNTNKESEISSNAVDTKDDPSPTKWQDYIPNLEYRNWVSQIGFGMESDEENLNCDFMDYIFGAPVSQTDPCLIEAVKQKFIIDPPQKNPSSQSTPLNIADELPTNKEKFEWVKQLLIENSTDYDDRPGFYIECGANDGSFISPTIRLEQTYNWTGLLIEANPIPFKLLLEKQRNAFAVNAALCIDKSPKPITFYTNPNYTGVSGIHKRENFHVTVNVTVQCIPFYTILKALDIKVVDYLSLDVEGLELDILKTLPFGKNADEENGEEVIFKVMTIEHWSIPGGAKALRDFLEPKGYIFVTILRDVSTKDSLFIHESLYEKAKSIKVHY